MKKYFTQSIKIIILGLVLTAGFSFAWTVPTGTFPNVDAPTPINILGTINQAKGLGIATIGSLLNIKGILSANKLSVFGNARVFGNIIPANGTIKVDSLNQANNPSIQTWPAQVCTDSAGKLTLNCGATGAICGNGTTEAPETCDDSNTASGDGCSSSCQTETQLTYGACGSANKTYTTGTSYGTDTFCSSGTASPLTPSFPTSGSSTTWQCLGNNNSTSIDDVNCMATKTATTKTRTYTRNTSGTQIVSGDSCTNCTASVFEVPGHAVANSVTAEVWGAGGGGGNAIGSWNKGEGEQSFTGLMWQDHKQLPAGGGGGGGGFSSNSLTSGSYTVTVGQGGAAAPADGIYTNNGSNDPYYYNYIAHTGSAGGGSSVAGNNTISSGGGAGGLGSNLKYSLNFVSGNPVYSNQGYNSGNGGAGGTGTTGGSAGNSGGISGAATHIASIVYYDDQYCNQAPPGGSGGIGANGWGNGGAGAGGYTGDVNTANNSVGLIKKFGTKLSANTYLAGPPLICSPACTSGQTCTAGSPNYCATAPTTTPKSPQCGVVGSATKGQNGKVVISWQE
jgi:cysteine-rich repeat protein